MSVLLLLGACTDQISKFKSLRLGSIFHLETIRDVGIAPLQEEFCFRACMCSLLKLSHMHSGAVIVVTSVLFGLSHGHHALDLALAQRSSSSERNKNRTTSSREVTQLIKAVVRHSWVQVVFTTVFGLFAALLFLHSGSLASSVSAHMLCNVIGPPDFARLVPASSASSEVRSKEDRRYVTLTYSGLAAFCIAVPILYSQVPST
jgi:prenyl protein peptidase